MIRIDIKVKGNYVPQNLFATVADGIRKKMPPRMAQKFYDLLRENIESNKYGFTLSKSWLRIKEVRGWDKRPFIAEHHYINAIEILAVEGHLTVGFRANRKHPRSGITYGELALLLEYGRLDKGLTARPLWRMTMKEFFANADKTVKLEVKRIIQEINI